MDRHPQRVSDCVADTLAGLGVKLVFEVAGGMVAPLLDSFWRHDSIRVVSVHHEQSAAFAAEACGRYSGRPAVAVGTSGPGALNLLSGIASCHFDSVPGLFLVGQVQSYLQRGSRTVRQFGLQEAPFLDIARPIAKAAVALRDPAETGAVIEQAYRTAIEGRPGPVVVELPFDVQMASVEPREAPAQRPAEIVDRRAVGELLDRLESSRRPLIHAGSGAIRAAVQEPLRSLIELLAIPLTTSVLARDLLPGGHPYNGGMPGTYGTRAANLLMSAADFILVLGSRLDQGQIGADPAAWARGKEIVQIDCDRGELGARVLGQTCICADLRAFVPALRAAVEARTWSPREDWAAEFAGLSERHSQDSELAGCPGRNPNSFLRQLSAASARAAAFVVDAGQHTWWAAQSLQIVEGQRFLAATGLWSMGSAIPAAVGAAFESGRPVVAIVGDGAAQMNIQELQTIMRNRLPVKVVVLNNLCLGMVRQFQDTILEGRHYSTVIGYDAPDFVQVAEAYGIRASKLGFGEDCEAALEWLWRDAEDPALLEVAIDPSVPVMPQVPFGRRLNVMDRYSPAVGDEAVS